jgi:hypothetical protein
VRVLTCCFPVPVLRVLQALPLFIDRLADPVTAVLVSVTAVLFFGECAHTSDNFGLEGEHV